MDSYKRRDVPMRADALKPLQSSMQAESSRAWEPEDTERVHALVSDEREFCWLIIYYYDTAIQRGNDNLHSLNFVRQIYARSLTYINNECGR